MKVLFCGYRDWAYSAWLHLCINRVNIDLAGTPEQLLSKVNESSYDVIVLAGWSWKVPDEVLDKNYVIGMHPSDLPAYAGGSPLQNQIIDGIKRTNASLFKVTSKFDAGPVLAKLPFSLEGHMNDVFDELTRVTIELVTSFLDAYPSVTETPQAAGGNHVRRLKPDQSHITVQRMAEMTCEKLYDEIRCREDPYPNVYIEDDTGRLYFKLVEFEPKA